MKCIIGYMISTVGIAALLLAQPACHQRKPGEHPTFEKDEYEFIVAMVIDKSGSYVEFMDVGGKAYRYAMRLTDHYFKKRIGSNDLLLIAQLSGAERALIWSGKPRALKRDFPNPKKFTDFLDSKANPMASRVHDALAETIEEVLRYPGVKSGKTRTAVFVLSDMLENSDDHVRSKQRVVDALERYAKVKGAIGIYWCDHGLTHGWRRLLADCGIRNFVVESSIVADPPLPNFDD